MTTAVERLRSLAPPNARYVHAPGRVNLIGGHVDYHEGFVVPMAIDRGITIAYTQSDDAIARGQSLDYTDTVTLDLEQLIDIDVATVAPRWGRLLGAVAQELAKVGVPLVGMHAMIASDLSIGGGLSSSAAFEVAVAMAFIDLAHDASPDPAYRLSAEQLAVLCQSAELCATGVPCGLQDQTAVLAGVEGHALLLDCRTNTATPIALPGDARVVVFDSAVTRTLEGSPWSARRRESLDCAHALGLNVLRDATPAQVASNRRGRHVVSEIARVQEFAHALQRGDVQRAGGLMLESHASSRDDFESSTRELDLLVELAVQHGAHGARLTGGGFGGCVVALVPAIDCERIAAAVVNDYRAWTPHLGSAQVVRATRGAHHLST